MNAVLCKTLLHTVNTTDERPNSKREGQLENLETLKLIFVETLRRTNMLPTLSCHMEEQSLGLPLLLRGKSF